MKKIIIVTLFCFSLFACKKELTVTEKSNVLIHSLVSKSNLNNFKGIQEQFVFSEDVENYMFPNGLEVQKGDNLYVLGGDIIVPQPIVDSLNDSNPIRSASTTIFNKFWHRGTVYYTIDANMINPSRVTQAMAMVEDNTSIDFQQRTNESDYIQFVSIDQNSTYSEGIGRQGGRQRINLASWATYGNAIHEIGHAIGLYHEHTRQDRDSYVDIFWNKIPDNLKSQYYKYKIVEGSDIDVFDFNSIMIYGSKLNSDIVMKKKDSTLIYTQRSYLSYGDLGGISYIYGPPFAELIKTTESFEENMQGPYEEYSAIINNELFFYSDKSFNNPTTTSSTRLIKVRYDYYSCIDEGIPNRYENILDIMIPAGVTSYSLPNTSYEYITEYGYVRLEIRETYTVIGVGY